MKIIKTAGYKKLSKKDWAPNPWAVCHTTVDKDEDPEKYERCVKKVKKKQASVKKAQLDIVKCVTCGITKNRDQMANSEVCYDCNDKDNYENS